MFSTGDPSPSDLLCGQPASGRRLLWQRPRGFGDSQQQEFIGATPGSPAASWGRLRADHPGGQRRGRGACGKWSEQANKRRHPEITENIINSSFSFIAEGLCLSRPFFFLHTHVHGYMHVHAGAVKPWLVIEVFEGFSFHAGWNSFLSIFFRS